MSEVENQITVCLETIQRWAQGEDHLLDELVYLCSDADSAPAANNDGLRSQIVFLLESRCSVNEILEAAWEEAFPGRPFKEGQAQLRKNHLEKTLPSSPVGHRPPRL